MLDRPDSGAAPTRAWGGLAAAGSVVGKLASVWLPEAWSEVASVWLDTAVE